MQGIEKVQIVSELHGVKIVQYSDVVPASVLRFVNKMMLLRNQGLSDWYVRVCQIRKTKKYWKLVCVDYYKKDGVYMEGSSGCAMGGIDISTGDIYKSASWAAMAKGIRGNVDSEQGGMEALGHDGYIRYLK